MATAIYLMNRMPTSNLSMKSPFECLFATIPNYSKLRVFGCLCFPWLKPYASNKLDNRSTPCTFLGSSTAQSAYFCLDRTTTRIYTSRHVTFHEYVFPFALPNDLTPIFDDDISEVPRADNSSVSKINISSPSSSTSPTPIPVPAATPIPVPAATQLPVPTATPTVAPSIPAHDVSPPETSVTEATTSTVPTRVSQRARKSVQKLNLHTTITPLTGTIPTSVKEALKDPRWR